MKEVYRGMLMFVPEVQRKCVVGVLTTASGTFETCLLHRATSAFRGNPEDNCSD